MAEPSVDRWSAWRQHGRCDGPDCDHPAHLLDTLDAANERAERARVAWRAIHQRTDYVWGASEDECAYCEQDMWTDDHAADCPWLALAAALADAPGPGWVEPAGDVVR